MSFFSSLYCLSVYSPRPFGWSMLRALSFLLLSFHQFFLFCSFLLSFFYCCCCRFATLLLPPRALFFMLCVCLRSNRNGLVKTFDKTATAFLPNLLRLILPTLINQNAACSLARNGCCRARRRRREWKHAQTSGLRLRRSWKQDRLLSLSLF